MQHVQSLLNIEAPFFNSSRDRAISVPVDEFEARINTLFDEGTAPLVDGYAPFCKHIFVPNFAGVLRTTIAITPENEALLRSGKDRLSRT